MIETTNYDELRGAAAIAGFIYGKSTSAYRRKVFYLASHTQVPISRHRGRLRASRSELLAWVALKEKR